MSVFSWFKKHRKGLIPAGTTSPVHPEPIILGNDLNARLGWFRGQLKHCSDVNFHEVCLSGNIRTAFIYIEGMIDQKLLQEQVLSPLMFNVTGSSGKELLHKIAEFKQLPVSFINTGEDLYDALYSLFEGTIVLLIDNESKMVMFPLRSIEKRSIETSTDENVIRGPKEAFVEDLTTNITMIRRRIKHPALKMEHYQLGTYSKTATRCRKCSGRIH